MTVPVITPLPPAPTRADAPSDFTAKADAFVAAQVGMVAEFNASAEFVDQRAIDADASAQAAADSATTAAQHEQGAGDQAALASAARQGAEDAEQQAQLYAAAAGAAAGVPALAGNAGRTLIVKADESGMEWGSASQSIGDVLATARDPGPTFLPADGGVYLQSAYPQLFQLVGLLGGVAGEVWGNKGTAIGASAVRFTRATNGTIITSHSTSNTRRSTDDGLTWTNLSGPAANCVFATDNNGVWFASALTNAGFRSVDDGATWANVAMPGSSSNVVYAVTTNNNGTWLAGGLNGTLYRSTDNGVTWTSLGPGVGTENITAISHVGDDTWLIGTVSQMKRSVDNGATWQIVSGVLPKIRIGAGIVTNGNGVWFTGNSSVIYRSVDDGATWETIPLPAPVKSIAVNSRGTLAVLSGSPGSIYLGFDYGKEWSGKIALVGYSVSGLTALADDSFLALDETNKILVSAPLTYKYDTATQFSLPRLENPEGLSYYIKALEAA